MSSKERLTKSALISAALHLAAVAVLFSKPLHLYPRFFSQIGKTPAIFLKEENIKILKRNQALDEAFIYFENPPLDIPLSHSKVLITNKIDSSFETPPLLPPITLSLPEFGDIPLLALPMPSLPEDTVVLIQPPTFSTMKPIFADPFTEISKTTGALSTYEAPVPALPVLLAAPASFEFIPSEEASRSLSLASPEMPTLENIDYMKISLGIPLLCEIPNEKLSKVYADFSIALLTPKSIAGIRTSSALTDYGLPTLELREWNEFFDVDVKTLAKEEGGFLFSINIIPKLDLSEYRLKQNYLFVIDRSNSVDKHRYQTAKRGTSRAIASLRPGDFFNIFILDASMTKFNDIPLSVTKINLQKAEEFLEKQSHHYHGAATDIYTTLTKMLSSEIAAQEAVTAILISDGDSPLKSNQQRKKINNWLEANRDRITLYTAAAGHGNNLSSLKMLSLASRGSLLYSDTHAAFPRKLAKLVMDLRYPIAKAMSVSIISPEKSNHIELLPPSSRLPYLFSDHPYVLIGSSDKLTDFTLLLEGKNKDQVFSIQKKISLSKAKQGSRLLLKQWAAEKAHTLFDQYLREGESTVLQQAEKQLGHDTQNSRR